MQVAFFFPRFITDTKFNHGVVTELNAVALNASFKRVKKNVMGNSAIRSILARFEWISVFQK